MDCGEEDAVAEVEAVESGKDTTKVVYQNKILYTIWLNLNTAIISKDLIILIGHINLIKFLLYINICRYMYFLTVTMF